MRCNLLELYPSILRQKLELYYRITRARLKVENIFRILESQFRVLNWPVFSSLGMFWTSIYLMVHQNFNESRSHFPYCFIDQMIQN